MARNTRKRIKAAFPDVPGRADFCVHWFRKAHEVLKPGCRAGLVGTNTIRQNYSREGGLDYIVKHGGTIIEAVSSQAVVRRSGGSCFNRKLDQREILPAQKCFSGWSGQDREGPWEKEPVQYINSSLSFVTDVAAAVPLKIKPEPKAVF